MEKKDYIKQRFLQSDITISDNQAEQFVIYYDELIKTNEMVNLTRITDFEEVVDKHFIDSAYLVKYVDFSRNINVIDIGTGAGFPSVPIKILYPNINLTLLDSLNKRLLFLDDLCNKLGLNNVRLLHGRAEDFAKTDEYREVYDISVSRAVSNLSVLCEYCIPYVKVGGFFVSYKSGEYEEELKSSFNSLKILGGCLDETKVFNICDDKVQRSLIIIKKVEKTEKKYPRRAGIPSKKPL